ncbi:MAG: hypothetical protein VX798_04410 [Bacteroidota bacterium]|nr:hypothetical protein [Bacteroidota bacterium]
MDFNPPIKERSDKQLFEIIENKDGWKPEAFNQAQAELIKRGISVGTQKNRRKSKKKYKSRIKKIKSSASYSHWEIALLIILGWPLCLIFMDLGIFFSEEGFERKNKQGIFAALLGLLFWTIVVYLIVQFS